MLHAKTHADSHQLTTALAGEAISGAQNAAPAPLSQACAPYAEALQRHVAAHPVNLMVPGHGGTAREGASQLADFFGEQAVTLDIPLMLKGIDLGDDSPLRQAQQLAAEAWGARRTWFMTNGASQANRTAAIAVRGLGANILSQRSAHSSFSDGVLVAGLNPSFVAPTVDERHGIAHGVTPEALEAALVLAEAEGRPAASVYVISPSYFGSVADVAGLARVAHAHGAPLIVDGAWGAHFGFHPDLPESPAKLGADLVVSSTHKLAGSFTQSAMLHLGEGPFADRLEPLVARAVTMTASTSESSLLMGSLDIARMAIVANTEKIGESIAMAQELRARLRADGRFAIISDDFDRFADIVETDLLRVPVDVSGLGQSGHWVRDRLVEEHHLYFEMSTATSIVAVIGAGQVPDLDFIMNAMREVADEADALRAAGQSVEVSFPPLPTAGKLRMLPRDAFFAETEVVPAAEAVGRVSSDSLAAYPPGIPNVLPGEEITAETVRFLTAVAASPTGYVRGAIDPLVTEIRVVREA
ncbi:MULTISPECIES: aminotransferase class I/II-fold pyridoxal phosphate-dependent enzyme [unclassified Leucobacter]|uniref:aminotransferase class I/II-fold pyridoxal phosphate-dependent enzyme n=1 Tax=unclassified Leucobacter TaxID=2621730 RepID=UPI00165DC699|nr:MULTISPECIES: amino acid decarboxylase [unclassified Leucobacter]MBC9926507.1 amino acid decarboxylase [Leucobacter sp. cx-169]